METDIKKHEDTSKGERIKVRCIQCKTAYQETNHEILKSYLVTNTDDEMDNCSLSWSNEFQVIECQGCEIITFREVFWFSFEGEETTQETLYPDRNFDTHKAKYFSNLPSKIQEIYKETLHSYNARNFILCAAGLRAIVESICTYQGIKDGPVEIEKPNGEKSLKRKDNLEGKIYGIYEKGILAKGHADILHEYRFLGNSALHELEKPSAEELALAIEIIEHILESVFEMPVKGNALKGRRVSTPSAEPNPGI